MNNKAVCLIFDKNYISQGKHAIISCRIHNPDYTIVLLTDDINCTNLVDIILTPKDLGLSENNWLTVGRVAIVEYVLEKLNFKSVVFIDGDIYTYNNYNDLQENLEHSSILVIPHITKPLPNDNYLPAHNTLALAGNYNTGMWAASQEGLDFIKWWKLQTSLYPIMSPGNGFFNEQGWLRFAADFDSNTKIFRHPGYNVAYWNIKQRKLEIKDNIWYIDNKKLTTIHFSGLNKETNPSQMSFYQNRYLLDENDLAYSLYSSYYNLIWC